MNQIEESNKQRKPKCVESGRGAPARDLRQSRERRELAEESESTALIELGIFCFMLCFVLLVSLMKLFFAGKGR